MWWQHYSHLTHLQSVAAMLFPPLSATPHQWTVHQSSTIQKDINNKYNHPSNERDNVMPAKELLFKINMSKVVPKITVRRYTVHIISSQWSRSTCWTQTRSLLTETRMYHIHQQTEQLSYSTIIKMKNIMHDVYLNIVHNKFGLFIIVLLFHCGLLLTSMWNSSCTSHD